MLFSGIVFSAVTMFLGIVTKLPQGGGGLANNLMVLSFFLPEPPLPPMQPPKRILFDLETEIAENQIFYRRNPMVTRNGNQGPMPRPLRKLPSVANRSNALGDNATFTFPTFAFSEFSLPVELTQFWGFIGTIVMIFIVLCLPWLVIKKMSLENTGPALQAASKPILTGFGGLMAQIEPLNPLFEDLRIIISGRNQAFADLRSIIKHAREFDKKAGDRDAEKEEVLMGLRAERKNALTELEKEKEKVAKLEKEKEREVDGLREETSSQIKAWTEKEKKWGEELADDKKRYIEAIDNLNKGRKREMESWRKQVEGLEQEKKGPKEAFGAKLKVILERTKEERERLGKEEARKEEKEGETVKEMMVREKKESEEKRNEEKKSWDKANDRAERRIADLEEENQTVKEEEAERQRKGKEAEMARETAETEKEQGQKRSEKEAQKEVKKTVAKLEEEVLNGRKLIEDLQTDKRRDRQFLLELRAQLLRPNHAAPPSHMNPFRFGGNAPPPFMGAPIVPGPSAFPSTGLPAFPIANHPFSNPISPTVTPLPSPRPTVRFPPRTSTNPAQLPAPTPLPPNTPKRPKKGQEEAKSWEEGKGRKEEKEK